MDWTAIDEFIPMVTSWPDEFCLVVHNRAYLSNQKEHLKRALEATGKVYFSSRPVTRAELPNLVASADIGLAPYKPVPTSWSFNKNIYHLGYASGKVSTYAMCGLPILARTLPVFERVFQSYQCGMLYQDPAQTGLLLQVILESYDDYRREARRFYCEQLDPRVPMQVYCDRLLELTG
jgi:glycosyltransferase involved in cell wall biosynthesis